MNISLISLIMLFSLSAFAGPDKGVVISVGLSPAGSFEAKSKKLKGGKIIKSGETFTVENIYVPTDSLETGMNLRDEHLKKRLGSEDVKVIRATGKNGKGTGKIKINGITKDFSFTYKLIDENYLEATFDLSLKNFNIKDISYMSVGVEDKITVKVTAKFKKS